MADSTNTCSCCGLPISDIPLYWAFPAHEMPPHEGSDYRFHVEDELFSDEFTGYFVRALLEIPIVGSNDALTFCLWATLSQENFKKTFDSWFVEGREKMVLPMPSWLHSDVPGYERDEPIGANLITMPVGERPTLQIMHPEDHPLYVDQRNGISIEKAHGIVKRLMGGSSLRSR